MYDDVAIDANDSLRYSCGYIKGCGKVLTTLIRHSAEHSCTE